MVGRYRLVGRLGEGGMGRVFLGVSPGGRQVAVKLIHSAHANDRQFRERFSREIEAARRVGGFHTASVVDADPGADPPWMVTAYIHGSSLSEAVRERGPFSVDAVCALGAGLAEGLAAIHACGLVHRDLKPSNVILAEDGPRIIDFGIARTAGASRMTTAGMVVGTYSYMSPEQVRGEMAGPASDVFSLGCTLAFAATAASPFGDDSIITVVYRITSEPPDLSQVPAERGLRQLISQCLAKDPGARPSLGEILDRLTRGGPQAGFAAGPVPGYTPDPGPGQGQAPSGGPGTDPRAAAAGDAVTTPPADLYSPTHTMPRGQRPVPDHAVGPTPPDFGPPERSRRPLVIAASVAVVAVVGTVVGILLSLPGPKPHPVASGHSSPRPTPSRTLSPPSAPVATLHDPNGKNVFGAEFGSNTVFASSDSNGNGYLWNLTTDALIATLADPHSNGVNGIAYNPGSGTWATADASGNIYLWDGSGKLTATLQNSSTLSTPDDRANDSIAVSPDGGFVAAGNEDGSTFLWDVAAGQLSAQPSGRLKDPHGNHVYGVAFSPTGSLLAAGDTNGSTYLWNFATGKLIATFTDPNSGGLYDVAFSPDGSLLAVTDTDSSGAGVVYLWSVSTGKLVASLSSAAVGGDYSDVAFSPNGKYLAAASTKGSAVLFNVAAHRYVAHLPSPGTANLIGVAFSPDGNTLAVTDTKGDAFIWSMKWLDG
jgi:hypothetical protein